jgi:anion-transporting  ArsA/GET3 family ATPase
MAPPRPTPKRAASIEQLLAAKEIAVTCGSGGVGKTTVAAALGTMATLELGGRVLVLTVDPARRLATALGLEAFGNVEKPVSSEAFAAADLKPEGELWVAMQDTRQSWDDLVRRHAPDAKTCDAILANSIYQNVSGRFVQSHDYIAMERLYELHASGRFDLIVVDTPPTRNALDFLDAPQRMADFFSSRLLRWLTVGYRNRIMTMASKPFYTVADRILGSKFLEDIAEFFSLMQTMEKGFVARSREVARILGDRRTTFCVVTTLEAAPVHEAEFFVEALEARHLHLGAVVVNKVLPASLLDPDATRAATGLQGDSRALGAELAPLAGADPTQVARVLVEVAESFRNFQVVAKREAEQRTELGAGSDVTVTVPYFDDDITDLAGLARLGATLWEPSA